MELSSLPAWGIISLGIYLFLSIVAGILIGAMNIVINGMPYIDYGEQGDPELVSRPIREVIWVWVISIAMLLVMPLIFWIFLLAMIFIALLYALGKRI